MSAAATLEAAKPHHSNGHKKATKTKHAAEAPATSVRRAVVTGHSRKEVTKSPSKMPVDTSPGASAALDHVNADIPPGATSTVLPAGIRRFDPDALEKSAITDPAAITGQEIECDLALLHRHPDNRKSNDDDSDVQQLAESIRIDNLIQAITVRIAPPHWDLPEGHYQIVCGERRWRACRVAGRGSVRCRVRADLDDAATLRIVAAENALRRDLNPIEKAHLIERLCTANEDGSKGLTRDEAAACVGLESGGAASNMARLLNLPEPWQKRIAAGEFSWSWAQEIFPYLQAEPVMQKLDDAWKFPSEFANFFTSRKALADGLAQLTRAYCRRLDAAEFDAAERSEQEVLDELECVELPDPDGIASKRKLAVFATNVKRFDELQAQARAAQSKAKAAKVGADSREDDEPRKTAARSDPKAEAREKIEAAERRSAQLAAHVANWRQKMLRRAISESIDNGDDSGLRIVLAFACGQYRHPSGVPGFGMLLHAQAAPLQAISQWDHVCAFRDNEHGHDELGELAQRMLALDAPTVFEHDFIDRLALDLGLDLEDEWRALQEPVGKTSRELLGGDLLEEFLLLHRAEELHAVAKSIEVHVPGATKEKLVEVLLGIPKGSSRRLKLPKSIKPLAIAGGKKTTKKRRAK